MIDREYPVVRAKNIQTAGKDEPEPSLGGAQAFLFDPICNPYHKCVGEEGIAKTLDGISDKEDRPVHIGNADSGKAGNTKGIKKEEAKEISRANVKVSGYIPKEFAPDDFDKISMYQKIDRLGSLAELEAFKSEVIDQYGRLPEEVGSLFEKRKLDILLNDRDVDSYKEIRDRVQVTFSKMFSQKISENIWMKKRWFTVPGM